MDRRVISKDRGRVLVAFAVRWLGVGAVLATAGLVLSPVESRAWESVREGRPELNLANAGEALGQGLVIGVLGGLRTVVADLLWLRTYHHWENRDRPKTESMVRLIPRLDPRSVYFWRSGGQMLAYDIPAWRILEMGRAMTVSEARKDAINREQAALAIELLQEGLVYHPESPELHTEIAQIYLNRLKDLETAAEWYERALVLPGATSGSARTYAEILRSLGREREAYGFLIAHYRDRVVAGDDFEAGAVLSRIREIEERLGISESKRFNPDSELGQD